VIRTSPSCRRWARGVTSRLPLSVAPPHRRAHVLPRDQRPGLLITVKPGPPAGIHPRADPPGPLSTPGWRAARHRGPFPGVLADPVNPDISL
jgi:hypothetical protein